MNKWCPLLLLPLFFACKNAQEETPKEDFFPVKSYLLSQIAHMDTSIYRIIKVQTVNGTKDTTFVQREDFRKLAKDFTELPDIAQKKWQDDYKETRTFDEALQTAVLNYTPVDEDGTIRRQYVFIKPGPTGDQVTTIFIETQEKGDVRKLLTWEVGKRFKITTLKQQDNRAEKLETLEVLWNERAAAE